MAGTGSPAPSPVCSVCKRPYDQHSGRMCGGCNGPVEHHDPKQEVECWDGRARMAKARQRAGLSLNKTDRDALKRNPNPPMLALGGYQTPKEPS